jgi:hypothetical protein
MISGPSLAGPSSNNPSQIRPSQTPSAPQKNREKDPIAEAIEAGRNEASASGEKKVNKPSGKKGASVLDRGQIVDVLA